MAEHLWPAANEVRNIERLTDLVHQENSFQKEMFGEKIFWEKCLCRIIKTGDESSWKVP